MWEKILEGTGIPVISPFGKAVQAAPIAFSGELGTGSP
jgi:hypothetical protein